MARSAVGGRAIFCLTTPRAHRGVAVGGSVAREQSAWLAAMIGSM